MAITRRDRSGIFDADLMPRRTRQAAVLDRVFQLSPKGITFVTSQFLPEWTEVGVQIRMPGDLNNQPVDCRGVIVQCTQRQEGDGFEVALLFLDLPQRIQKHLRDSTPDAHPLHISVAR
jgi:hypothetical protein